MRMRLLIVDDERPILQGLVYVIERMNTPFDCVESANSCKEAFEKMNRTAFDLVLTDIRMPGMTGLELIRQAKEQKLCEHFAIISGHSDFDYVQTALRQGAVDYLLKPVDKDCLNELLLRSAAQIKINSHASHHLLEETLREAIFGGERMVLPYGAQDTLCVVVLFDPSGAPDQEIIDAYAGSLPIQGLSVINLHGCSACVFIGITDRDDAGVRPPDGLYCGSCTGQVQDGYALQEMFLRAAEACLCGCHFLGESCVQDTDVRHVPVDMEQLMQYEKSSKQILGPLYESQRRSAINPHASAMLLVINQQYQQDLTLESVSKIIGLNPAYAGRVFKQQFQDSFTQYLNKYRIGKATEYLDRYPDWSFEQIAAAVGFHEIRHFYRVFKQKVGMTPGEYRRKTGPGT